MDVSLKLPKNLSTDLNSLRIKFNEVKVRMKEFLEKFKLKIVEIKQKIAITSGLEKRKYLKLYLKIKHEFFSFIDGLEETCTDMQEEIKTVVEKKAIQSK
jgi:hypothetical protein